MFLESRRRPTREPQRGLDYGVRGEKIDLLARQLELDENAPAKNQMGALIALHDRGELEEVMAAECTKPQMAAHFGMTEKTFKAVEERQLEVSTAYRTGRAKAIANIGSVLYEKAIGSDIRAIQFYLKTQAGWAEQTHVELSRAEEPEDRHWTVEVVGAD